MRTLLNVNNHSFITLPLFLFSFSPRSVCLCTPHFHTSNTNILTNTSNKFAITISYIILLTMATSLSTVHIDAKRNSGHGEQPQQAQAEQGAIGRSSRGRALRPVGRWWISTPPRPRQRSNNYKGQHRTTTTVTNEEQEQEQEQERGELFDSDSTPTLGRTATPSVTPTTSPRLATRRSRVGPTRKRAYSMTVETNNKSESGVIEHMPVGVHVKRRLYGDEDGKDSLSVTCGGGDDGDDDDDDDDENKQRKEQDYREKYEFKLSNKGLYNEVDATTCISYSNKKKDKVIIEAKEMLRLTCRERHSLTSNSGGEL